MKLGENLESMASCKSRFKKKIVHTQTHREEGPTFAGSVRYDDNWRTIGGHGGLHRAV